MVTWIDAHIWISYLDKLFPSDTVRAESEGDLGKVNTSGGLILCVEPHHRKEVGGVVTVTSHLYNVL